jgi:hypothetical protein
MAKNTNLKPLQEDKHGTGHWNFSGKNLSKEEMKNFAEEDFMPDGRLKLPKFRRKWRKSTVMQAVETDEQFNAKWEKWQDEWEQLDPNNRPRFGTWLIDTKEDALVKPLFRILTDSGRKSEIRGAINTLWEHFKTKPKTQVEVSEGTQDFGEIKPEELLRNLMEFMGYSYEKFERFLATNDTDITTQ